MSTITQQVVDEHWFTDSGGFRCVSCAWRDSAPDEDFGHAMRRHIAEVTERAVRERIVADIEARGAEEEQKPLTPHSSGVYDGLHYAARIAGGGDL